MNQLVSATDQRRIYLARKAVHVYQVLRRKYVRATDYVNAVLGVDHTFPPMVRVTSLRGWRKYKQLVVSLEEWIKKDGMDKFRHPEVLHRCVVVLGMALEDCSKRPYIRTKGLTRSEILENISLRRDREQKVLPFS
jgi:hypothetical protein